MKKKLDFTGVETFQIIPEGTHVVKIAKVLDKTFQSGSDGFSVAFEGVAGPGKGCQVFDNFPIVDTALWKIKTLLEAVGIKADGKVMLDTDKLIGKRLEIDVELEEYQGKDKPVVKAMRKIIRAEIDDTENEDADSLDDLLNDSTFTDEEEETKEEKSKKEEPVEEPEEAEEKPKKKSAKSKKKKEPEPEPEAEDDWSDDDEDGWEDA